MYIVRLLVTRHYLEESMQNWSKDLLKNEFSDWNFDQYFLCGPEEMIDTVKDILIKERVKEDAIKFELFSSTSYKKEVTKSLAVIAEYIVLDDEETSFEMRMDEIDSGCCAG